MGFEEAEAEWRTRETCIKRNKNDDQEKRCEVKGEGRIRIEGIRPNKREKREGKPGGGNES